jgi:hypothetical protein
LGGGRKGVLKPEVVVVAVGTGEENAESKASKPKKSFEDLSLNDKLLFVVVVEAPKGANGSDPKGSLEKASLEDSLLCCFAFRWEKGSKESSKFIDGGETDADVKWKFEFVEAGANGSLKGDVTGSDLPVDPVVEGQADAKGSTGFDTVSKLKGSCAPKSVDGFGFPNAVVTGAVNGSSLSLNGSAP